MKLEIYNESKPKSTARLRLKMYGGEIRVVAVDEDGNTVLAGNLIGFLPDGRICRYTAISSSLGFDLDEQGRIIVGVE